MIRREFLNGKVTLYAGDCMDVLAGLPANSVDSIVTDPPYHLTSIVKRFGSDGAALAGRSNMHEPEGTKPHGSPHYQRLSKGFMGKVWDGGDIAFQPATWAAVLRVLKPGGHMVAFSGTRTYHRMAVAIEDAGFEIRDQLAWMYGSGFPKSHDVSKGIDRAAGAVRETVGRSENGIAGGSGEFTAGNARSAGFKAEFDITAPATAAAREWQGWGTALKPAWEPICLARKPLIGTVAANVLEWGTGAINIGACRIETAENLNGGAYQANPSERHDGDENWRFKNGGRSGLVGDEREGAAQGMFQPGKTAETGYVQPTGRWPANIIHDGSDEVLAGFPETVSGAHSGNYTRHTSKTDNTYGERAAFPETREGDSGSAARFFYTAKADSEDRLGSKHPTVKPLDLKQYLCRLITPPGGTVLDLFAGTGTTGEAAWREGFRAILIEREAEYQADIARRMELAVLPTKRAAVAKTKNKLMGAEGTPLFPEAAE